MTLPDPVPLRDREMGDIVLWKGAYVGVGNVGNAATEVIQAAAWISTDWTTWTQTMLAGPPGPRGMQTGFPTLVATTSRLLAFGRTGVEHCVGPESNPTCDPLPWIIWSSADGRHWRAEPTPAFLGPFFVGTPVAQGATILFVGYTGWEKQGLWISRDAGRSWTREDLSEPLFHNATLGDIKAVPGGWAMVGYREPPSPPPVPGGGAEDTDQLPAAWFSTDGLHWQSAPVAGATRGHYPTDLYVASGGLSWDAGFVSSDGHNWTKAPPHVDQLIERVSDGQRIIATVGVSAPSAIFYASTDGSTWRELLAASDSAAAPTGLELSPGDAFLLPTGLGVVGYSDSGPQLLWLATPITAP